MPLGHYFIFLCNVAKRITYSLNWLSFFSAALPNVFRSSHSGSEDEAEEKNQKNSADVFKIQLTHRRRSLVFLSIKNCRSKSCKNDHWKSCQAKNCWSIFFDKLIRNQTDKHFFVCNISIKQVFLEAVFFTVKLQ